MQGDHEKSGGIALNEDSDHYFYTRTDQALDAETVAAWVDQYAGTQVKELMLCPNSMRASYASAVWEPIWLNYDPAGTDDQPLFQSLSPEARTLNRRGIHTAWQLHKDGIDIYKVWIRRCRDKRISPWLSVRMNDVHFVDDEQGFSHSEFWRKNPQFRRVRYRYSGWNDRAFDYAHPEVRAHYMNLIRELTERYDFDGLELDWMRFGFHFKPGHEAEGREILTGFTSDVRKLLDKAEQQRGHRIKLGARIPSRPQTAIGLGMDGIAWARQGLVDMLVITPFLLMETDLPVALWKQLLDGTKAELAAGLEITVRPYPQFRGNRMNSLETTRGAAASFLDQGADRIYLFNFMDRGTGIDAIADYASYFREIGSLDTLREKPRRHVVTYSDIWAPGEPQAAVLPAVCLKDQWKAFRIHIGPKPDQGRSVVGIGIEGATGLKAKTLEVRVNGALCPALGRIELSQPAPDFPVYGFEANINSIQRGCNLIEMLAKKKISVGWIELGLK